MINVLNRNGNGGVEKTWARIDNKVVSAERHEDLFGGHGNEQVDDLCVYMLFYCCTALGPISDIMHNDLPLPSRSKTSCPGPCVLRLAFHARIFGALSTGQKEEPEEGTGEMEEPS